MRQAKQLLIKIIIGLLFIYLGWLGGWWDELIKATPTKAIQINPDANVPGLVLQDTKVTGWDELQKNWEIEAARIWQFSSGAEVHFQKIKNGIIYSLRGERVRFQADWGRWERLGKKLHIGGQITAFVEKGQFLTNSAVMYYEKEEMLFQKKVQFIGEKVSIKADTMRLNFAKDKLLLKGTVDMLKDDYHIKAEAFDYDLNKKDYQLLRPEGVTLYL